MHRIQFLIIGSQLTAKKVLRKKVLGNKVLNFGTKKRLCGKKSLT